MKSIRILAAGLGLTLGAILLPAPPASATIHEIVAQWCAGKGELQPPGIQSGKNFAQPVNSNGFVGPVVPFEDGFKITFNYNVAPAKVIPTGEVIQIGTIDGTPTGAPLYIDEITPDPRFAAFMHCPKFATG
jgi:hypothetical protein